MAESIPLWHYTVGTCPAGDASPWMHAPCISVISPKPCVLHPHMELLPPQACQLYLLPTHQFLGRPASASLTGTSLGLTLTPAHAQQTWARRWGQLCYLEPRSRINHWVAWEEEGEIKRTMVGKGTRGKAAELCGWGPERLAG